MITKQKLEAAIGKDAVNRQLDKIDYLDKSAKIFFIGGNIAPLYDNDMVGYNESMSVVKPIDLGLCIGWDNPAPHVVIQRFIPAEQSRQYPWFEAPCFPSRSYVGGEKDDWQLAFKIWSKDLCAIVDALEKPAYEIICKNNKDWSVTRLFPCRYASAVEVKNKNDSSANGTKIIVVAPELMQPAFITELGSYHTVIETMEDGFQRCSCATTIATFYPGEFGWELATLCAKLYYPS